MDATALIGQNATTAGLQKQAAAQAAAVSGVSGRKPDMSKMRDTSKKFEAFFIGQMMEHMTAGIETDPMFGGGHGEDMWKSMLNQEYGKEISKSGRLGIADQVLKGMIKMQEDRSGTKQSAAAPIEAAPSNEQADPAMAEQDAAVALVAGARLPIKR